MNELEDSTVEEIAQMAVGIVMVKMLIVSTTGDMDMFKPEKLSEELVDAIKSKLRNMNKDKSK